MIGIAGGRARKPNVVEMPGSKMGRGSPVRALRTPDATATADILACSSFSCSTSTIFNSFTCDIVFDFRTSVLEAFNTVARVGLASHTMNGEKFSIVIDDGDLTPTQLFTLRNSRNLTVKKIFPTKVDAVRVRFADREKNFKTREVIIFSEGQTLATATEFESLDTVLGITEVEKLNKHVKYELAASRLRPEIFQWDVSLESAIAERGDVVLLRHDVVLFGTGQARVASVVTNSSLVKYR